jgi:hypothetical protein
MVHSVSLIGCLINRVGGLYRGLKKAEARALAQLRTGANRLNDYLTVPFLGTPSVGSAPQQLATS